RSARDYAPASTRLPSFPARRSMAYLDSCFRRPRGMKPQKIFNRTIDAGPEPPLIQLEAGIEQGVQNKVPQNKGEEALRRLAVVGAADAAGTEVFGKQA